MELAEQMCKAKTVETTGEVTFKTFIDFFSQEKHERVAMSTEEIYNEYNNLQNGSPQSIHMISILSRCPFKNAASLKFLQQAANCGHVGVANALLKDYIAELRQ